MALIQEAAGPAAAWGFACATTLATSPTRPVRVSARSSWNPSPGCSWGGTSASARAYRDGPAPAVRRPGDDDRRIVLLQRYAGFHRQAYAEEERSFRGVASGAGFASVAVVPIRYKGSVLGVIHLADERPGMLPSDVVDFMECIGPLIGEAAHRFKVKEEFRKGEERYRSLVVATSQIVWTTNPEAKWSISPPGGSSPGKAGGNTGLGLARGAAPG